MDWPVYRGDPNANQSLALAQIDATNVHKVRTAWEHPTETFQSDSCWTRQCLSYMVHADTMCQISARNQCPSCLSFS